jgi:hypothetical protein
MKTLLNQALRHEDVWGSGSVAPCILSLYTKWWRKYEKRQSYCNLILEGA